MVVLNKDVLFQLYDNDFTSIINIHFYETYSTSNLYKSARASLFRHPVWH